MHNNDPFFKRYSWFSMLCWFLLYVHMHPLFSGLPSHLGHHRALSGVPCAAHQALFRQLFYEVKVLVTQLCPTLCNPMDCRPPGSSVLGILQARILEWVVIPSPGDLLDPRTQQYPQCTDVNSNLPIHPTLLSLSVSIHLFSTSVSLFLPCKQVHLYHFSRFQICANTQQLVRLRSKLIN